MNYYKYYCFLPLAHPGCLFPQTAESGKHPDEFWPGCDLLYWDSFLARIVSCVKCTRTHDGSYKEEPIQLFGTRGWWAPVQKAVSSKRATLFFHHTDGTACMARQAPAACFTHLPTHDPKTPPHTPPHPKPHPKPHPRFLPT